MNSKTEELYIEINRGLKPKEKLKTASLSAILSKSAILSNSSTKIYCCSSNLSDKLIEGTDFNPVLKGYYKAYVNHCPICITPDILWMLIIQGFSRHVDQNSEKLRNKFVNFEGKKTLISEVTYMFPTIEEITKEAWEKTFEYYVEKIRENVGGLIINLLTPCFTTSTSTIQNSAQIAIMSSFKSYFNYVALYGGCGFPYIKLEGTYMDYMQLKMKIQGLLGYGIDDWLKILIPIVDKILETKQEKIDKNFWENILKNFYVSGPYGPSGSTIKVEKLTGWLLNFYPFLKVNRGMTVVIEKRNDFNEPVLASELKFFAEEIIDAPLIMKDVRTGKETELTCKTGFLGDTQDEKSIIKPEIGWYICSELKSQPNLI